MADIFISYSHEDQNFVRRMAPALEAEGFSVWWDHTIPPGQSWDSFIARGIKEAKVAVVVWSQTSVASEWVKEEASIARGTGKYLPVQIDSADPPIGFSRIQAAQLVGWDGNAKDPQWLMLMSEVRRIMTEGGAVTPTPRRNAARSSESSHATAKKHSSVPAILMTLALLIGAGGAAGYFYLKQSGEGSEAKTDPAAPVENSELAELRRQMAETQAALAEERRLREEAEKHSRAQQTVTNSQSRSGTSAARAASPDVETVAPSAPSAVGSWSGYLNWGIDQDDGPGLMVFYADGTISTRAGSRGTWSQNGVEVSFQFPSGSRYRGILSDGGNRLSGTMHRTTNGDNGSFDYTRQ